MKNVEWKHSLCSERDLLIHSVNQIIVVFSIFIYTSALIVGCYGEWTNEKRPSYKMLLGRLVGGCWTMRCGSCVFSFQKGYYRVFSCNCFCENLKKVLIILTSLYPFYMIWFSGFTSMVYIELWDIVFKTSLHIEQRDMSLFSSFPSFSFEVFYIVRLSLSYMQHIGQTIYWLIN